MFTIYLPYIYHIFTICLPYVYHMFTIYLPYIYHIFTIYVQHLPYMSNIHHGVSIHSNHGFPIWWTRWPPWHLHRFTGRTWWTWSLRVGGLAGRGGSVRLARPNSAERTVGVMLGGFLEEFVDFCWMVSWDFLEIGIQAPGIGILNGTTPLMGITNCGNLLQPANWKPRPVKQM